MTNELRQFRFTHRQRMHGRNAFAAVYNHNVRKGVGPLLICARPNNLSASRLGLSVSRKIGSAVRRGRVKRLLRESFRLAQHDLPAGYDFVIVVRPHDDLKLADYQRLLATAINAAVRKCQRRKPCPANNPKAGNVK